MTAPTRSTTNHALRRPLAVASVIALTSGLAMGLAPAAGAARIPCASSPSCSGGNGGLVATTPVFGPIYASEPLECTDDNLDGLARASGGEMHAIEKGGECFVVHRFTESGRFIITSLAAFESKILIVGGGGGGGGGGGWEDALKAAGAEPDSGAGAGGGAGTVRTAKGTHRWGQGGYLASDPGASNQNLFRFFNTPTETASDLNGAPTSAGYGYSAADLKSGIPVTVGRGGSAGSAGTSTAGSTAGGQGGVGGSSSFGEIIASGGGGGFGGGGTVTGSGDVQNGSASNPRTGGQRGGGNADFTGGDLTLLPYTLHSAPGGAGSAGPGLLPVEKDLVNHIGDGGNGGPGTSFNLPGAPEAVFGIGGGGGTISAASPPYAPVVGGNHGADSAGGAGGVGEDGTPNTGNGGGGGGTDGSVTVGDSNAGAGGRGGNGFVYVHYTALSAPGTPAAPSVVAGDGSVTLTITPLPDTPDQYYLWVAGDPDRNCTITPPETSCVIEGLTNGESYTFLAAAGNAAGHSAASTASVAVAPGVGILPYTGNNTRGLTALALTMIGLGGGITALTRRRRTIS